MSLVIQEEQLAKDGNRGGEEEEEELAAGEGKKRAYILSPSVPGLPGCLFRMCTYMQDTERIHNFHYYIDTK